MKVIYTIILFLFWGDSFAQSSNLLYNGDFEIYNKVPTDWGEAYKLNEAKPYTTGAFTPISYFYNIEEIGFMPYKTKFGNQDAYKGNGFIGVGFCLKRKFVHQIELPLLKTLNKDSTYIISAWVSLADKAHYALDFISATLDSVPHLNKNKNINLSPLIELRSDSSYIKETTNWIKISYEYKAKGGEKYFILGGIMPNAKNKTFYKKQKMPFKFSLNYIFARNTSYYFIDDISIKKKNLITTLNSTDEFSTEPK
jgi:OOP family OmpA-OmpF porin